MCPISLLSQSQRRVTFHLPDGSQESCSDSGLGEPESVGGGALLSKPLPLAQEEFYEQDKRTEADGNSDPNSGESKNQTSSGFGNISKPANAGFWFTD